MAIPVRVDVSCAIVKAESLTLSVETIDWLGRDGDPPAHVVTDLDRISRQRCKLREICDGEKPPECGAKQ